jgi:uncharacterized membrane protein required for colicin V production
VAHLLASLNGFDVLVIIGCLVGFIIGYLQGVLRRLLGIAVILLSFIVAAQLRAPLGDFLAANWTQWPSEYSAMIGFGFVFLVAAVLSSVLVQVSFHSVRIWPRHPSLEAFVGAILGVVEVLIVVGIVFMIVDPYYTNATIVPSTNELPYLRGFHDAMSGSASAQVYRGALIPAFLAIAGGLVPEVVRNAFHGAGSAS